MPISNPYNYLGGFNYQPIQMPTAPTDNWATAAGQGISQFGDILQSYYDRQQKQAMLELERQKTLGEIAAQADEAAKNKLLMDKKQGDDKIISGIPQTKDVADPVTPAPAVPPPDPNQALLLGLNPKLLPPAPAPDQPGVSNFVSTHQVPTTLTERQAYINDPKNVGAFATPEGQAAAKLSLNPDADPLAREGAGKFTEWAQANPKATLDQYNSKAQEIEASHPGFTQTTAYSNIMNGHKAALDDERASENAAANQKLAQAKLAETENNRVISNQEKDARLKGQLAEQKADDYSQQAKVAKLLDGSRELSNVYQILGNDPKDISAQEVLDIFDKLGQLGTGGKPGMAVLKKEIIANGGVLDKSGNVIQASPHGNHALTENQRTQLRNLADVYKKELNDSHNAIYGAVTSDFGGRLHALEPNASTQQFQADSTNLAPHRIPMPGFDPTPADSTAPKRKVYDPTTGTFSLQ